MCSISPASSLSWFTSSLHITSNLGKLASMILSKWDLLSLSLALKRYARQTAKRHCKPARTDRGSLVFSSCRV